MTKKSQIIFMNGKEKALKSLFTGEDCAFGYLAIGYAPENNGFEDTDGKNSLVDYGFNEVNLSSYERIKLELYNEDPVDKDIDTGKVLVKFTATLTEDNISETQMINQVAVVDSATISADTEIYSATTFPTFTKTQESSITFVIGFRL